MSIQKRIGFACKWIDHEGQVNGIKPKDDAKQYNTGSTTVRWLNNQTREVAEQKLWDLMMQNTTSTLKLVYRVGELEPHLRMVRLSSDILPVYTQADWAYFWQKPDVKKYCEQAFGEIGDVARRLDVRLSFHPGQFTVLASENPNVVERSIEEFEYHCDMIRWMGYGRTFQDFKCNVHISGKQGPDGIKRIMPRLSTEARNTLTIENDEISWGLDASLELVDTCALVLDIHHHFIKTGEYIDVNDDRFSRVIDSWRGVRPVIHYSVSREDVLTQHDSLVKPDLNILLESGHKKQKLRAHSDFYWNEPVTDWALTFLSRSDIMCESKAKNLASFQVADRAKMLDIL
jgi:UV DNA damage endonuclease